MAKYASGEPDTVPTEAGIRAGYGSRGRRTAKQAASLVVDYYYHLFGCYVVFSACEQKRHIMRSSTWAWPSEQERRRHARGSDRENQHFLFLLIFFHIVLFFWSVLLIIKMFINLKKVLRNDNEF